MNEDKLASARKEIEEIDREIAQLYLRRLEAVKPIAAYKKEHGLPVFDGKREDDLIKRNLGFISSAFRKALWSFPSAINRDLTAVCALRTAASRERSRV